MDYANLLGLLLLFHDSSFFCPQNKLVSRDKTSLHYKVQIGSQADISTSMFQFQFQTHASHLIPAFQTSCTGHDHQHKSLITQNHSLQYQSLRYAAMYTTHDNFLVSFHKNLTTLPNKGGIAYTHLVYSISIPPLKSIATVSHQLHYKILSL